MKLRLRYLSLIGLVAVASGCATTIAERHPHLDRRSVCLLVPGIENDSTGYIFNENNVPVSNLQPELLERVAPNARTVFEYDPDADRTSTRYLPAPYNALECPERFSMFAPKESKTKPLPVAAVNLLLRERRPEPVSKSLADELAKCSNQITGPVAEIQHTMQVDVYVKDDGQTVFAHVVDSTLGNRKLNACVAKVLRNVQWSAITMSAPNMAAAPIALKGLLAQPAPVQPQPDPAPESGIRRIQPQSSPSDRVPRLFVIPINPLVAGLVVFGVIYFWLDTETPSWTSEMSPITRQPYADRLEYDEVQRLSPEEIQQRRAAHIKATESQPPPAAPASPPAPTPTPQPEQSKPTECPRNEIFIPLRTDNATGCTDKKGNVRCYSSKHRPCAGVHTHGRLRYQEIRNGVCKSIEKKAVRCDGPFEVTGQCGSVSTVECNSGGSQVSGIHEE